MTLAASVNAVVAKSTVFILQASVNGIWNDQAGYEWPGTADGLKAALEKAQASSYRCRVLSVETTVRTVAS